MPVPHNVRTKLVYEIDLSRSVGANSLASITAASVVARGLASGPSLTITAQAVSGQRLRLELDGGADGELYRVEVVALDDTGQEHAAAFEVQAFDFDWTAPDGSAGYLAAGDYLTRFPTDETVDLTDVRRLGRIDKDRLFAALLAAKSEIDGYLATRYTLPLTAVPDKVRDLAADLARWRLYVSAGASMPDLVKVAADQARAELKFIAQGVVRLPVNDAADAPASTESIGAPLVVRPVRRFTDTIGDF